MKGSKFLQSVISLVLLIISTSGLLAQDPPAPNRRPPEDELPIDQDLHYLLLVGLAFGLYWAVRQIKSQRSRD